MALKNDENISAFGQRILNLMVEKGCDTTPALAEQLLDKGLVKVNSREGDDPFKKRNNAIGSIERKIRVHIHSDDASCLQGEFVIAYCKFFECSADYLFGFTEVRTPDINVREICDKTGLSEAAVLNLVNKGYDEQTNEMAVGCWSMILGSALYRTIPNDWLEAGNHAIHIAQMDAQLKAAEWELTQVSGPDILDLRMDMEGYLAQAKAGSAAFSGLLFKISRNVADFIEHNINRSLGDVRGAFDDEYLAEVMKKYK